MTDGTGGVGAILRPQGRMRGPAVVAELRRALVSGEIAPGTPIPVEEVAKALGVSPIPVREALKALHGEGLLWHRPRLGYRATQLSPTELSELYVVRGALEAAAVGAAARLATESDRKRARRALAAQEASVDPAEFQHLSRGFHEALLAPSAMPRLLSMLETAWNLTEPAQSMMQASDAERAALHADHHAMLDAFSEGAVERLIELSTAHHERLTAIVGRNDSAPESSGN